METIISCDWGTTALRLRLIDIKKISILAGAYSKQGISHTYDQWKKAGGRENERLSFYQSILAEQIKNLEEQMDYSLNDIPLIISGMAFSNMGMEELPYKEIPFNTGGDDLYIKTVQARNDFNHSTLMISGVKSADDAMRGEETQLIGCLTGDEQEDQFFIFPGTHSKHISVKDGKADNFKTYMTGEFFEFLSTKSVLSNVVEKNDLIPDVKNQKSFENGITASLGSDLLHSSFLVRTNYLLNKLSKEENYWYLSGLLIGTELKDLINNNIPITIVCDELQGKLYSIALRKLNIENINIRDAGRAIAAGHSKIYNQYKSELKSGSTLIKQ